MPRRPERPPLDTLAVPSPLPLTATLPSFRRLSGKGHNAVYKDLADGEYESVVFGARRYVDLASYQAYVERCRTGQEREPAEKLAAIRAYRRSLRGPGGRNAARARTGIGRNKGAQSTERGAEAIPALARPRA
jgi:hypothetical protein